MVIGIPVEIRNHECRVGATPELVGMLADKGCKVLVETKAGVKSGFRDEDYEAASAVIVPSPEKLYSKSEIILKVKSPNPVEYELIQPHHTIFAYFQFFSNLEATRSLMARGCNCFTYDLLRMKSGLMPLLNVDRQITGQLAVQQGAYFIQAHKKGRGVFLGEVPGVSPAKVGIVGANYAAIYAALYAARSGAHVTMFVPDAEDLTYSDVTLPPSVKILESNSDNFKEIFPSTDLLICAAQRIDETSTAVIDEEIINLLPAGAVTIDLDIEFGGSLATSQPTTYENPVFVKNEIIHYCVPGIAGTVPVTASAALSQALQPLILKCAEKGFAELLRAEEEFYSGLAIFEGRITNEKLAEALAVSFYDFKEFITSSP